MISEAPKAAKTLLKDLDLALSPNITPAATAAARRWARAKNAAQEPRIYANNPPSVIQIVRAALETIAREQPK